MLIQKTLYAILRINFHSFVRKVFNTLNEQNEYQHNWHIDLICDYLMQYQSYKRLIINLPPRTLKSTLINISWPMWLLGLNPSLRIITVSYSQIISQRHTNDCIKILNSKWYKNVFPNIKFNNINKNRIYTTENGFRFSTSIGGSLTGDGGDIIIIDDPHNPTHIYSNKLRIKVIEWYQNILLSRLNNPNTGSIIIIMQRLHRDDICGYINKHYPDWTQIKIPIIANENILYKIKHKKYFFKKNTLLDANRFNNQQIKSLTESLKENFHSQYMQNPTLRSNIVSIEMLQFYSKKPMYNYTILSWDTAVKVSDKSDYSVCTIWGILNNTYYLIDFFRAKIEYPILKHTCIELIKKWCPRTVIIEDQSSGAALIQDLQKNVTCNIYPYKSNLDKITRLAIYLEVLQNNIYFPDQDLWSNIIINEIIEFPNSKHDDIVDSITQFMAYIEHRNKSSYKILNL